MSRVRMTIDRLVLNGIGPDQKQPLMKALEGELSRVLADPAKRGDEARSHRTPVLRLSPMALEPGAPGARKFGAGMARGIAKGLKR